ncbi:hypothetical protein GCM10010531_08790 [Blastococcus jejuensis]|uniref:Condensation domain-containing protein n=1 Tax=Blastococcus jejuensis TaxID=351224 RepID=A0ABP6NW44_9ACTN
MTRTVPTTDALAELWSLLERDDRPVCGVEHEYEVRDAAGAVVDFRTVADTLDLGRRLDPGDRHAHRGPWGGVITADGREAEVVSPPVPVGPDAAAAVHAYAAAGRAHLAGRLPAGWSLTGYSTHISTAVDDDVVRRAAVLVVRHLSPALMLLFDRRTSPGLLVRPRPGRLEVCGEFAQGRALRHAVAVVVAAGQLCSEAARTRRPDLPPRLRLRTERAKERFGSYVDRAAFGGDLYAAGRTALLRRRGGTVRAGELLAEVVDALDDRLRALLTTGDLAALHAVVAGDEPLPCEQEALAPDDGPLLAVAPLDLRDRRAGEVAVEVVNATWWTYVLRLEGARVRWLTVPRTWMGSFLDRLDDGSLDDVLTRLV